MLTNAAVEGARVGILPGYSADDAEARAERYAAAGGIDGVVTPDATTVFLPEPGGGTWPALQMTVTHPYTFQFVGPVASMFSGSLPQRDAHCPVDDAPAARILTKRGETPIHVTNHTYLSSFSPFRCSWPAPPA